MGQMVHQQVDMYTYFIAIRKSYFIDSILIFTLLVIQLIYLANQTLKILQSCNSGKKLLKKLFIYLGALATKCNLVC
jgi:hypothetical protein